jgi:hypothetical protein
MRGGDRRNHYNTVSGCRPDGADGLKTIKNICVFAVRDIFYFIARFFNVVLYLKIKEAVDVGFENVQAGRKFG